MGIPHYRIKNSFGKQEARVKSTESFRPRLGSNGWRFREQAAHVDVIGIRPVHRRFHAPGLRHHNGLPGRFRRTLPVLALHDIFGDDTHAEDGGSGSVSAAKRRPMPDVLISSFSGQRQNLRAGAFPEQNTR